MRGRERAWYLFSMSAIVSAEQGVRIAEAAERAGLRLVVLFGSRARGEAGPASDWDFGYLSSDSSDPDALLEALVDSLRSDRIDLVDLGRAGALIRYRAARDGHCLFEDEPRRFERFQLEAASFWCDVEPVLRQAYAQLLAEIAR